MVDFTNGPQIRMPQEVRTNKPIVVTKKKPEKTKNIESSKLLVLINEDKNLDSDTKLIYINMAKNLLRNFKDNINKTSLELNEIFPVGMDIWQDFLSYPVIRKYTQSFKDEQINIFMDKGLMEGSRDAMMLKKSMIGMSNGIDNSNIILIRVNDTEELQGD